MLILQGELGEYLLLDFTYICQYTAPFVPETCILYYWIANHW